MTDMTTFEQQVAAEVIEGMGHSEPVDDLAILEAVVATHQPRRWGFASFAALKVAVAAAVVALFGGFLLAGILTTQPSDEILPAATTESPSPMTTEELLSGMVTEEVEPGVFRVVNDGVRDIASEGNWDVVVGQNGGVWLRRWQFEFLRLGTEAVSQGQWPDDMSVYWHPATVEVDSNGTLWTVIRTRDDPSDLALSLRSYDGTDWQTHQRISLGMDNADVDLAPDGTVWVTNESRPAENDYLGMLGPDGWQTFDVEGRVYLSILDDGVPVLVSVSARPESDSVELTVSRFEDGAWHEWRSATMNGDRWWEHDPWSGPAVGIGPDGTVWVATYQEGDQSSVAETYVARVDGSGMREWGPADGVPSIHLSPHVAPDGSLWGRWGEWGDYWEQGTRGEEAGVVRFDGETWTRYLATGHEHHAMDIAADGSVWLLAGRPDGPDDIDSLHLFVITPEAVAAKEAADIEPSLVEEPPAMEADMEEASTTGDLLSGMATEKVEPGVFRIVSDGVRDMEQPFLQTPVGAAVVIDDFGDVWRATYVGDPGGSTRHFRVGADGEVLVGPGSPAYADYPLAALAFAAGLGGSLSPAQSDWLDMLDGAPQEREDFGLDGIPWPDIRMQDDGTVWLLGGEGHLVRLPPDGVPENMNWRRVHDGYASDLMVTADGEVWLLGSPEGGNTSHDALLHFDGSHWEDVPAPDEVLPAAAGARFDVGADGTLWAAADAGSPPHQHLARYDGVGWTIFGEAEGVRPWGGHRVGVYGSLVDMLRVAPDGSAWVNAAHPDPGPEDLLCGGLGRFDGVTWASYLHGMCILDLDFAPDGVVWVVAVDDGSPDEYRAPDSPVHTFVITPEAVAGTASADSPPSSANPTSPTIGGYVPGTGPADPPVE